MTGIPPSHLTGLLPAASPASSRSPPLPRVVFGLGGGMPFFPALQPPLPLRLIETHTYRSGVAFLRYQVS